MFQDRVDIPLLAKRLGLTGALREDVCSVVVYRPSSASDPSVATVLSA